MSRYPLLFLLLCIFVISCEYEPEGLFDAELSEPNNPPNATINLNDTESPIDLCMKQTFTFYTSISTNDLYLVEILFNNSTIYTTESNNGNFTIDPKDYSEGNYILELKVYSKTGSGSLADIAGVEAYVYSRQWEIIVDLSLSPVNITSIIPESGNLKITWEEYTRSNFKRYELYKISNGGTGIRGIIYDQNTTSCYDNEYIGGTCEYFMRLITEDDSKDCEPLSVCDSLPRIVSVSTTSNMMTFKWTKCKYSDNFEQYALYEFSSDSWDNLIQSIRNINDTVLTTNQVIFGRHYDFYLATASGNNYAKETTKINTCMGETHEKFTKALSTKATDYLFQMNNDYLYRFSIIDDNYTDSLYLTNADKNLFEVSLNGEYLTYGTSTKILKLNPLDFKNYIVYTPNDISGNNEDKFTMLSISDNGIAAICGSNSFSIYDFNSNTMIYKQSEGKSFVKIAPNGKYIYEVNDSTILYEISGTQLNVIYSWSEQFNRMGFNPINSNELIYYDELAQRLRLFDCQSLEIKKNDGVYPDYKISIDPITGLVFTDNYSAYNGVKSYEVININTETAEESINAFLMDNYIFHNSVIYSSTGYSLKLNTN